MRTPEEIKEKIKEENKKFMCFQSDVLINYLSLEQAEQGQFLKSDHILTPETWTQNPLTTEAITSEMREYMSFAIEKTTDHRGLSANRSIDKMKAWLWLLQDQDLLDLADNDDNYQNYGAPILLKICQKYKLGLPMGSDFLRMTEGLPCRDGCDEGCSS